MTRIDFYILEDAGFDAVLRFACRLSLKAYQRGHPVHVRTSNDGQSQSLDELMWDYPKHHFIPHRINGQDTSRAPVHISAAEPEVAEGLLINLGEDVPPYFGRFDRVAEIIVGATRETGRERYAHYRKRGYPLHHHELKDWEDRAA